MSDIYADLLSWFGLSGTVPENFAELIPYIFMILFGFALVIAVFKLIGRIVVAVMSAGKRL